MRQGAIKEEGTHDELLALNGAYADFWGKRVLSAQWKLAWVKKRRVGWPQRWQRAASSARVERAAGSKGDASRKAA